LFGKSFGEATVIRDGKRRFGRLWRDVPRQPEYQFDQRGASHRDAGLEYHGDERRADGGINGTVASPQDAAQAEMLVRTILNPGIKDTDGLKILPVNRLKVATPLQVTLKVRIAEVNRTLLKNIGVNLFSSDPTSGFKFGIGQGSAGATSGPNSSPFSVGALATGGTTLGAAGKLLGLDISGAIDLAQKDGVATILAEPNLTALSGETASFLAGGEYPIPISQSLGAVSIEYKQYGVGLAFTPIVLADGRISMRVRPEVSELSDAGSIKVGDVQVPALITRRAETTVELGSGQSLMIAGLLRNSTSNNISKAPFLGDIPILGMLFRSTAWKREESELVIIVTPYLVRPVSNQLATPSDGYRAPDDAQETFLGQTYKGVSGVREPTCRSGGCRARSGVQAVTRALFRKDATMRSKLVPNRNQLCSRGLHCGHGRICPIAASPRSTCRSSRRRTTSSSRPRPAEGSLQARRSASTPGSRPSASATATASMSTAMLCRSQPRSPRSAGNYGMLIQAGAPVTCRKWFSRAASALSSPAAAPWSELPELGASGLSRTTAKPSMSNFGCCSEQPTWRPDRNPRTCSTGRKAVPSPMR
jgi:pilus assembly protein CpaC